MGTSTSSTVGVLSKYLYGAIAIIAPASLLLYSSEGGMSEYPHNIWFIAYHGEYFRTHHAFPITYETTDYTGVAIPVYYGCILFKIGGLLSLVGGCHGAFRIVVLCFAAVYLSVRNTMRKVGSADALATVTACAVTWAIYPLTNLYTRCAFSEFVAAAMLTASCCYWTLFFLRPRSHGSFHTACLGGLFQVMAMGTHPIVAMFVVPLIGVIYIAHWLIDVPERPGFFRIHLPLIANAGLILLVLSPWLYAYSTIGGKTWMSNNFMDLVNVDGDKATAVGTRLFPVPIDSRRLNPESQPLATNHLDLQINLPLLAVALVLLAGTWRGASARNWSWKNAGILPIVLLGLLAFLVSVTVYPSPLATIFAKAQFGYRFITVVDLSILITIFAIQANRRVPTPAAHSYRVQITRLALLGIFAWTALNLNEKLEGSQELMTGVPRPKSTDTVAYQDWLQTSGPQFAFPAYKSVRLAQELDSKAYEQLIRLPFPIGTGKEFGKTLPLHVEMRHAGYVGTQALPWEWSTFKVDGSTVPTEELRTWKLTNVTYPYRHAPVWIAVPVPEGAHTIECETSAPVSWVWLNRLSHVVFSAWFLILICHPLTNSARIILRSISKPSMLSLRRKASISS